MILTFKDAKKIETERLIIRPFEKNDLLDFYEYCQNPNVGPNAGWKPHKSIEESKNILNKFINGNDVMAIEIKTDKKVIGSIGLHKDEKRSIEKAKMIGYILSESYWGKGFMTECVKAVINFAFENMELEVLSVFHFSSNERSHRVIEKCGFKLEGTLRKAFEIYDGRIEDDVCYSIIKEDWEH